MTSWPESYSDMLYAAAARWGIEVPAGPDRPVINDAQAPLGGRLPVVEELRWTEKSGKYHYAHIRLISFGGLWSFALNVQGYRSGHTFGPCMKFCPPYPTRIDALRAAVEDVRRSLRSANDNMPGLDAWLESVLEPVQMSLFAAGVEI